MSVYYVSPTGSDETGTGTKENPFATIGRADELRLLRAGDTVSVAEGEYSFVNHFNSSGLPGKPITYKAEGSVRLDYSADFGLPGEAVAYVEIDGFTFAGSKVSFADCPQGCAVRNCVFEAEDEEVCAEFNNGDVCSFVNNKIILTEGCALKGLCAVCTPNRLTVENNTVEGGEVRDLRFRYDLNDGHFPNTEKYFTLQGDFHVHTSDGSDGHFSLEETLAAAKEKALDIIAITDHGWAVAKREYADKQREKAQKLADEIGIIYLPGFETGLTYEPRGGCEHIVVFDSDTAKPKEFDHWLSEDGGEKDYMKRLTEINEAGAFVIWPHPDSDYPDIELADEFAREPFKKLIDKRYIKGVEVINGATAFNPSTWWGERYETKGPRGVWTWSRIFDYAIEHNLAIFANTDVHESLVPCCTLILAKERTRESAREAMEAGRTAAYFEDILWAKPDVAEELMNAMVPVSRYAASQRVKTSSTNAKIAFTNNSPMLLMPEIDGHVFVIKPHETIRLFVEPDRKIKVKWTNVYVGSEKCYETEY